MNTLRNYPAATVVIVLVAIVLAALLASNFATGMAANGGDKNLTLPEVFGWNLVLASPVLLFIIVLYLAVRTIPGISGRNQNTSAMILAQNSGCNDGNARIRSLEIDGLRIFERDCPCPPAPQQDESPEDEGVEQNDVESEGYSDDVMSSDSPEGSENRRPSWARGDAPIDIDHH